MDTITQRLRAYFGPALGELGASLNPEASELEDEQRLLRIDQAIGAFRTAMHWYRNDVELHRKRPGS